MSDSNGLLSYSGAFGQPTSPDNALAFTLPATTPASTPVASSLVPANYADVIGGRESGSLTGAQNPYFPVSRGGPLGPHQFLAATWKAFASANPQLFGHMDADQILAARTDPALSAKAANWYAGVNAPILQSAGVPVTPVNLAIGHALGGAGAAGVLKFHDSTPLRDALLQSQPKAADAILAQNPTYGRMTVGDLKAKYAGLGGAGAPSGSVATAAPASAGTGVAAAAPPNPLSSLSAFAPASLAAMAPIQRLAMIQQLQQLFAPPRAAQQVAQAGGPQVGGVDASIPLAAGRA